MTSLSSHFLMNSENRGSQIRNSKNSKNSNKILHGKDYVFQRSMLINPENAFKNDQIEIIVKYTMAVFIY
ncbi:hypothetical protein BpHYR1_037094 [Brachionus plicatilis]|uniref:Uncharacterized protein n=1 Tax=Brachionus plicatilis TaxID=10195 RepID=A0A3M7SBG3_BRAPC|nr:hypothetical protein BpHYR1_037094 [Brachionus plicatilis]